MKRKSKEIRFFESILPTLVNDLQDTDRRKVLRAIEILSAHSADSTEAVPMLLKLTMAGIDLHVARGARIAIEKIVSNTDSVISNQSTGPGF